MLQLPFIICVFHVLAAGVQGGYLRQLWEPQDISREEWLRCHGLPCDVYARAQGTLAQIFAKQSGLENPDMSQVYPAHNNGTIDGCIMLSPDQAKWILGHLEQAEEHPPEKGARLPENLEKETLVDVEGTDDAHHRQKRKITNFDKHPYLMWPSNTITYKFDGKHSASEQAEIRGAFAHWEAATCIRFREAALWERVTENHILVTNENNGCYSYVGRVPYNPQQLNLQDACLWEFGIAVHEIGHSLGLWHEQMRFDRDSHIRIVWDNLGSYRGQFTRVDDTVGLGVPYDHGSVMHYSPRDGSANGGNVIEAIDPLYQSSMGQRTGLSFHDARIINYAYCAAACPYQLAPGDCQNGGYQDPNNCHRCRCPDGLDGYFCERVAASRGATVCGGDVTLSAGNDFVVTSPGYPGAYDNRQECQWWLHAPAGHRIHLHFQDQFGLYCHHQGECLHWVEVRYKGQMGAAGPRFCCYRTPSVELVSHDEQMLVIFRSNWTANFPHTRRGFRAVASAVPVFGVPTFTTTTTTTTTTATTTAPTTTTTTTTTTTLTPWTPPGASFEWSCDFEAQGAGAWCGMEQDGPGGDDFDWTFQTGRTPSRETGPQYAYSGQWYIFIEASNPRRPGDVARLRLPPARSHGEHCLAFRYHMHGFHVNELRVFKESGGRETTVWRKYKQKDNWWLQGEVALYLDTYDRVGFVGVRGAEFSGDIALDDLRLTAGRCTHSENTLQSDIL